MQKRRAFWLVDFVTPRQRDRAILLHAHGIEVQFFTSVDSFLKELDARRAGIIIVSDHEELNATEKVLSMLMNTPEIQGAKMMYICSSKDTHLRMFAAGLGFRDIIPDDLEDHVWLQRIQFAAAGKPIEFRQPAIQTSIHQISGLTLPARIVWISSDMIRIECRARPAPGSSFALSGQIAEAMGVGSLSLTVKSSERTNLLYRFSDALVCNWSVPTTARPRAEQVLEMLRAEDPGPRCRIFVAVQHSALRREILTQFDDPRFEIATAIQKNSIADDPRFFSPDMVLIESSLCSLQNEQFTAMMNNLPDHSAVAIFGKLANFSEIRSRYSPRTVIMLNSVPRDITASALNRFLPIRQKIDDVSSVKGSYLPTENPMSIAEINLSARLTRVHPAAITVALPFPVSKFALARVDCPYIRKSTGRNLFLKVTKVYRALSDQTQHHIFQTEGYLADVSPEEQRRLAMTISSTQTEALKFYQPEKPSHDVAFYRIPVAVPPPPERESLAVAPERKSAPQPVTRIATSPENTVAKHDLPQRRVEPETPPPAAAIAAVAGDSIGQIHRPSANKEFVKMAQRFAEPAIDLETDDRINLKDEIGPMIEAAGDLRDEFVQGLRDGVQSDVFKSIAAIFLTVLGLVIMLWLVANHIAPAWEKSGMQYSERLKEFAPHLKQPQTNPGTK